MERHQLGIAGEPCGEVIWNKGEPTGLAVEYGGRNGSIGGKSPVLPLE